MMYSPHAVFYGFCDDPTQNWSVAFPDGMCEQSKPLLLDLVQSTTIKKRALALIQAGAVPEGYGHLLYECPKCHRLFNRFYFQLKHKDETFEPAYKCSHCKTMLKKAALMNANKGKTLTVAHEDGSTTDWRCPQCGNNSRFKEDTSFCGIKPRIVRFEVRSGLMRRDKATEKDI
jgi:DNA-directed RNA polymerase subunit RPC12/RpoP